MNTKSIKLKNYHLNSLYSWFNMPLHSKYARARNRFLRIIIARIEEIEEERKKLLNKYAKKDKDGKEIIENNNYVLGENLEAFNKEYGEMIQEEYVIDILPSNREDIYIVRDMLLNLKKEFDFKEGEIYDEICLAFENTSEEKNK